MFHGGKFRFSIGLHVLLDTVDEYRKHIIICDEPGSAATWPKLIEDHPNTLIQKVVKTLKHEQFKITLCDRGTLDSEEGKLEMFVFDGSPGYFIHDVGENNIMDIKRFGFLDGFNLFNISFIPHPHPPPF